ncbi:MAG: hypothetical protein ACP5MB_11120 [bacterium]
MDKTTKWLIGGGAAITAIAGIAFLASKSKASTTSGGSSTTSGGSSTTSSTNVANLLLYGPITDNVNTPTNYTVVATDNNNNHVSGVTITLTDLTTGTSSTATTDNTGTATFTITFNNPGTYVLQASCC